MNLFRLLIICFCFTFAFVTCKKKDTQKEETYTPTCSGTRSFQSDVFPLIKAKCWRCHNNMTDYNQIQGMAGRMKDMVSSGVMPKDDKLTKEQKDIIVCWVEAGAPNN